MLALCAALVVLLAPHISVQASPPAQDAQGNTTLFFPVVATGRESNVFGAEAAFSRYTSGTITTRTDNLGVYWTRMPHRISWRALQPVENGPINWQALTEFEAELRVLRARGIQPIIMVRDHPRWATVEPNSCSRIRADKFDDFAAFMVQLVNRYKQAEFDVHYWEFGNEPDVAPWLLEPDSVFGCWGDSNDPYYGGEYYGQMLQAVAPALRQADPSVKIMIGGLLLDAPHAEGEYNHPSRFFEGILRSGAASAFDIVAFHGHASYRGVNIDYTGPSWGNWAARGGWAVGKASFLKEVMARYGVSKPIFLNETTFRCVPDHYAPCSTPSNEFFQQQAAHVPRLAARSMSVGVTNIMWYTIEGPGWHNGGLLDGSQGPRPVYHAYRALIDQIGGAQSSQRVSYAPGTDAYRFSQAGHVLDVIWSNDGAPITVSIPRNKVIEAYNLWGNPISPTISGNDAQFTVGFNAIYVHRQP